MKGHNTDMEVPQKVKNRTVMRSSNPTSEYICKKPISGSQRGINTPMFIAALITIAKTWKQTKCHRWMSK